MKAVKGYLGPDLQLEGSLSTIDSIRIDCAYVGSITSEHTVLVGSLGNVKGHIEAPVIRVDGRVEGDLRASQLVEILKNAQVEGDIYTPNGGLEMQLGGEFSGKFIMNQTPQIDNH
ncbi:MAG: polymer-forming cytoskeletal protein [SAR324 cluster bacterium]|nr:polymer-forming cytoskeletal protein [SAR324 cluster bacterium]MBL7035377.1 polymer-forming cytoskeletal protein [SAR324 cluster bacterium]